MLGLISSTLGLGTKPFDVANEEPHEFSQEEEGDSDEKEVTSPFGVARVYGPSHASSSSVSGRRRPRSEAAIEDGRKYLSAYRRRLRGTPETSPKKMLAEMAVPRGLASTLTDGLGRYQKCAPNLARNLEASLTSPQGNKNGNQASRSNSWVEGAKRKHGPAPVSTGDTTEPVTPETLRQVNRSSQAEFLLSVLNEEESTSNGQSWASHSLRAPLDPSNRQPPKEDGLNDLDARGKGREHAPERVQLGRKESMSNPVSHWATMRSLAQKNRDLGSIIGRQLDRALELCRGVTGGQGGGLLGHDQASYLVALQSTLQGIKDLTEKKEAAERLSAAEAEALGGPASLNELLLSAGDTNGNANNEGHVQPQLSAVMGDHLDTETLGITGDRGNGTQGWVTGGELRTYENKIRASCAVEVAALQSEKRKLQEKVSMYQRQVHFLENGQRQQVAGSATAEGIVKRHTHSLTAAISEDDVSQLCGQLEAEIGCLRQQIEERDGLADALKKALHRAVEEQRATQQELQQVQAVARVRVSGSGGPPQSAGGIGVGQDDRPGSPLLKDLQAMDQDSALGQAVEEDSQGTQNAAIAVVPLSSADSQDGQDEVGLVDGEGDADISDGMHDGHVIDSVNSQQLLLAPGGHASESEKEVAQAVASSSAVITEGLSPAGLLVNEGGEREQIYRGVVGSLAAAPGAAWRAALGTARVVGKSVVGTRTRPPRALRGGKTRESHAVLIM
ncbi:unnamed protein product [Discosporangium mesarthrocarpum]